MRDIVRSSWFAGFDLVLAGTGYPSMENLLSETQVQIPNHRGIVESLGFACAWLGDTDHTVSFLKEIPEARNDLDAHYSWWQGRDDLSQKAFAVHQSLDKVLSQP